MSTLAYISKQVGPPQGLAHKVVKFHNTNDIINQIQAAHKNNAALAQKFAHSFKRGSHRATTRAIFDFVKNYIKYHVEPADRQTTKTIQRMLADGHGDCKHYSGFIAANLDALGIPFKYRFVSFKRGNTTPTHVYVVAQDEQGQDIYLDAVLPFWNTEKPFAHKKDLKIMPLYHLSGVDEIGSFIGRKRKQPLRSAVKATGKAVKKAAKATGKAVKKAAPKAFKGAKTVSLAPARAAYLALVSLNVRGLATQIANSDSAKVKARWNALGGNYTKLQNAVNKGKSKKRIMGLDMGEHIGAAGATTLATAAPIIVSMSLALKGANNIVKEGKQLFEQTTGQKVEDTPLAPTPESGSNFEQAVQTAAAAASAVKTALDVRRGGSGEDTTAPAVESGNQSEATGKGFDTKTLLLIGGAGLALFLIMKK
jgi:hypothetical protein